ncbi:MAG: ABC transporter ATP-binding protein/permease [Myxococcales bacterium]|nr:ABC transporter ATP-binding protein/permease [Myxococcales bacterium]
MSPASAPLRWRALGRRLGELMEPEWLRILGALGCTLIVAGATVFLAWLTGPAAQTLFLPSAGDRGANLEFGEALATPLRISTWLGGALLLRAIGSYLRSVLVSDAEEAIVRRLRQELHRRLLELPAHEEHRRGELGARIVYETGAVRSVLGTGLSGLTHNLLLATALAATALALDAAVATPGLLLLPFVGLLVVLLSLRSRRALVRSYEAQARLAGQASESASLALLLRAYEGEAARHARFDAAARETEEASRRAARLGALVGPSMQVLGALAIVGLLAFVIPWDEAALDQSPARYVSLAAALLLLYVPIRGMALTFHSLYAGLSVLARIHEFGRSSEGGAQPAGGTEAARGPMAPMREELRAEALSFSYGEAPLLEGVDLRIRRGEAIGLVGASGAGKSTLLLLLGGLLEPTAGKVRVDGIDLRTRPARERRQHFSWVPQKTMISRGTLLENIALGAEIGDPERAARALELAAATELVERLGLEGALEEEGANLSEGERRRIGVARALYRDAPILLLDEPAASLDAASEAILIDTLRRLRGRTTIVIATHRARMLEGLDRIVQVRGGRVQPHEPTHEPTRGEAGLEPPSA